MTYVGLDIETTGLEPELNHRTIQLGLAFLEGDTYTYDILPMKVMTLDPGSLEINGFNLERICGGTPSDELDDIVFNHFSKEFKAEELIPVGWNVGPFDYRFLKADLPKFSTLLSHRVVDLTGICMMRAEIRKVQWRSLKKTWQDIAEKHLGESAEWHDALWDARAAIKVWELLINERID